MPAGKRQDVPLSTPTAADPLAIPASSNKKTFRKGRNAHVNNRGVNRRKQLPATVKSHVSTSLPQLVQALAQRTVEITLSRFGKSLTPAIPVLPVGVFGPFRATACICAGASPNEDRLCTLKLCPPAGFVKEVQSFTIVCLGNSVDEACAAVMKCNYGGAS